MPEPPREFPPLSRKVIQLAVAYDTTSDVQILYALCDDGTMWQYLGDGPTPESPCWAAVTPIPQE